MAENERYDWDSHLILAAGTTTSFSHLLFAEEEEEEEDDISVGLNGVTTQIFKCSTSSSSSSGFFPAELLKKPKMLCFGDHYPNKEDQMIFSKTKSGVTCSDSSSSASSTNSTVSKSINRKRNQESVQCTSAITTMAVADQRSSKKIKIENPTSTASPKRKEKLGERITALQQLVSPFGKTDTASVLHEAMGYIRFLQEQVQVLCSPYLQQVQHQQRLPSLPEDENGEKEGRKDLRSRGLCLVPMECTVHVAGTNGADLWSPAMASNISSSTKR